MCLRRGKRSIALDLKSIEGKTIFLRLIKSADILIEPFRPETMERLDLGPSVLMEANRRLIYARLSGFGQSGRWSQTPGHDINFLAVSGVLSKLGANGAPPMAPLNLLGDFAGGGLNCAFGICMAIIERHRSGQGQVIDANIVEGIRYVSSWLWHSSKKEYQLSPAIWPNPNRRGANLLDGGAPFYGCYKTIDGKFMAVGSIEPQFYFQLLVGLEINTDEFFPFDICRIEELRTKIREAFASRTQEEWTGIFSGKETCVTPVVDFAEVAHSGESISFLEDGTPRPAPHLCATPARPNLTEPKRADHTLEVLLELGYCAEDIEKYAADGVVELTGNLMTKNQD